jgi:hypothetical protein
MLPCLQPQQFKRQRNGVLLPNIRPEQFHSTGL